MPTRFYMDAKTEQKIRQVENIFILPPRIKAILDMIDKCRWRSKLSKEPYCMLILGPQGVGKTTTYEYYQQQYPRTESVEGTKVPVLSLLVPAPATVKNLASEMLKALGDPASDKGTIAGQTTRLRKMLKDCEVELIILDEFQHFIDRDSQKVLHSVSDWLKVLINSTAVPVVLCGMPYSNLVLDTYGNEQLRDRFSARIRLEPYGWSTREEQIEFRTFLAKVDEDLPLAKFDLGSKEMAFRFFCASNGFPRHVMRLIRSAAITAIEAGKSKLTLDFLADAYDERYADEFPGRTNPFLSAIGDLEIVPFPNSGPKLKNLQTMLPKETASEVLKVR